MRAITGAVVSSEPCNLKTAHKFLTQFCSTPDSYLTNSDCATYVLTLEDSIREQHNFLRRRGRVEQQQGAADFDAHGYEGLVEGAREQRQGGEKNRDSDIPAGGPHGSVEEVKVAVAAGEKKSRKRKKEEEPQKDNKAVAGVGAHIPASPEILSEQRKKKKEKHSSKELLSVVKQEPDLVVEELGGSKRKKGKHSDKELPSIVKQEPGLVVEELGSEKKKGTKKKEKIHVKLEEDAVEVKGQIVNNGVVDQGIAVGEKKRKKKKHSEEEGDLKGVKEEEKMVTDSDLNSEKKKKKKKRGRGHDGDDNVQEQGEHKKKKQRKES